MVAVVEGLIQAVIIAPTPSPTQDLCSSRVPSSNPAVEPTYPVSWIALHSLHPPISLMTLLPPMNEPSDLAVSYFQYYSSKKFEQNKVEIPKTSDKNRENGVTSVAQAVKREECLVWQADDEWTEEEISQAEALLEANLERCRCRGAMNCTTQKNLVNTTIETAAAAPWDRFYRSHGTHFFKDRHYLATEFPNEFDPRYRTAHHSSCSSPSTSCLVEVGCGVGNALLPLLEETNGNPCESNGGTNVKWKVIGLDLSAVAIDLLRKEPRFQAAALEVDGHDDNTGPRAQAYCCDIVQDPLPPNCFGAATVTTLFFCLSAIHPQYHERAALQVAQTLAPGGVLVIRDYGRYDAAQLKLGVQRGKQIAPNFYQKHDGTNCYYFDLDDLERLFGRQGASGLETLELKYHRRKCVNRLTQSVRRRVWVQARFQKPFHSPHHSVEANKSPEGTGKISL